jgi:hypothetical protein
VIFVPAEPLECTGIANCSFVQSDMDRDWMTPFLTQRNNNAGRRMLIRRPCTSRNAARRSERELISSISNDRYDGGDAVVVATCIQYSMSSSCWVSCCKVLLLPLLVLVVASATAATEVDTHAQGRLSRWLEVLTDSSRVSSLELPSVHLPKCTPLPVIVACDTINEGR